MTVIDTDGNTFDMPTPREVRLATLDEVRRRVEELWHEPGQHVCPDEVRGVLDEGKTNYCAACEGYARRLDKVIGLLRGVLYNTEGTTTVDAIDAAEAYLDEIEQTAPTSEQVETVSDSDEDGEMADDIQAIRERDEGERHKPFSGHGSHAIAIADRHTLLAEIDRLKAELKNAVEYNDQDFEVIESISKERDRLNAELAEAQDLIDSLEGDPEQVMWKVAACKAERARIVAVLHKVRDRWARQSSWWVAANSAIKAIEADA